MMMIIIIEECFFSTHSLLWNLMNKSNFFFCQQQNFVHYNDNTNKWHKFFASKFALKTKTQVTFEIILITIH